MHKTQADFIKAMETAELEWAMGSFSGVNEVGSFWVVSKPSGKATLADICWKTDVFNFSLAVKGGLTVDSLVGLYSSEASAMKVAKALLQTATADAGYNKQILDGYLVTMLWSSNDAEDEPLDENYGEENLAPEVIKQAKEDVEHFVAEADKAKIDLTKYNTSTIGHDMWLTRCGHGAGFWDGDYDEADGEALTKIAKKMGNLDVYIGDDGFIWVS